MQKLLLLLLVVSVLWAPAQAAEPGFRGVEALMSRAERAAAGIDKLSPAELAALNQWLRSYLGEDEPVPVVESAPAPLAPVSVPSAPVSAPAPAPAAPVAVTPPPRQEYGAPPPDFEPYTSRIKGEFTGWDGHTRFYLENGDIYEQRRPGRWRVSLMNPEVRITKNFLGAFDMEVISEGRSMGVRRLK